MKKILFICHGNICRSPMAEFITKHLVAQQGFSDQYLIASAATSHDERGRDIYPPAQQKLREKGVPFQSRHVRQVTPQDGEEYDLLVCMDKRNMRNARKLLPQSCHHKLHMLTEYSGTGKEIADPWYTRDFERAYLDIDAGCRALLQQMASQGGLKHEG